MLTYQEIMPHIALQAYIRKYWVLDNLASAMPSATKYALPNTCVTLAFISGNGVMVNFSETSQHIAAGAYLVGQATGKIGVTVLPHTRAFMVQLNAWAAALLTNCPFHEITDQFAELTDVNKVLGQSLRDFDIPNNDQLKQHIEKALGGIFYPSKASEFIAGCFNYLNGQQATDGFPIAHLAHYSGYSMRGLEKKFKQHVGLSPKQVYTILRVRSAVDELVAPHDVSLTALAYRYGYTDQAHFIKTFRHVLDCTPGGFNEHHYLLPLQK